MTDRASLLARLEQWLALEEWQRHLEHAPNDDESLLREALAALREMERISAYVQHKPECRLWARGAAVPVNAYMNGRFVGIGGLRSPTPEEVAAARCTCGLTSTQEP